ncbi:MAG: DUF3108 domain-containing protein [Pseudomonadota bacterium]
MMIRRPLLWTLTLSVLLHACWMVDVEWAWPWRKQMPEQVLATKKAEAVKRVRLAAKPKTPRSDMLQVTLLAPGGNTLESARKIKSAPVIARQEAAPAPSAEAVATPASPNLPPNSAPLPNAPEPELTFPLSVLAKQRAHYYGFAMDLSQQWLMEGTRYVIRNEASKFGFKAEILSEGRVSPEGLQPEQYRLTLNNTLRNYANFDRERDQLVHGKAGAQKFAALTSDMQDMASLPFHVAVTYEGTADRRLMVTTGSSVYEITLRVVAEETLKLPGGTIQTIHLQGNRTRSDGTRQEGYNIWLAPRYRNFPVRFSGPDSKGNLLEMSVSSLAFDGKTVFGRDLPALPDTPAPAGIPEQMQRDHLQEIPAASNLPPPEAASSVPESEASAPEPVVTP